MATLTHRLLLSEELLQRIQQLKRGAGLIYGIATHDVLHAFGIAKCKIEASLSTSEELLDCITSVQYTLPAGMGFLGYVLAQTADDNAGKIFTNAINDLVDKGLWEGLETPLFMNVSNSETRAYLGEEQLPYEVLPASRMQRSYMIIHLQGQLTISAQNNARSINEEIASLNQQAKCGVFTFFLKNSGTYLRGENEVTGLPADGCVKHIIESKKKRKTDELEVYESTLRMKPVAFSTPGEPHPVSNCAPVVLHRKSEQKYVLIPLMIDALSMISREASLTELYRTLVESLRRNFTAAERSINYEMSRNLDISLPQAFHFIPSSLGHVVTLVYPRNVPDLELRGLREKRHKEFLLSLDRPLFWRACRHYFPSDIPTNSPLFNPHEGLQPPSLRDAETSMVQGRYRYYHYMQGGMDDSGWGCAYRSLQTLVSWFVLQGYIDQPSQGRVENLIPSHKAIQECLVDMGDKQASFIGSRQWIGSTEVSYVLQSLYQITSRILSVNSSQELCSRADELFRHFNTHGTPVMIGGGVLAHTILGVCLERENGDVRFLVLDPHYTGAEDLTYIQNKGWCGWKGPDFWVKNAFYNLCMPQRPSQTIC